MPIVYLLLALALFSKDDKPASIQRVEYINLEVAIADSIVNWEVIAPYKKALDADMNQLLCYSPEILTKGQAESLLGNWSADACLAIAEQQGCDSLDMVLFNNGGLRSLLPQGNIIKKHLFQLMPFENELVVLSLNLQEAKDLFKYVRNSGGQPMAFTADFDSTLLPFNVLTSDYLANGGDKMKFFKGKKPQALGIKMRDAMISYCSLHDTLRSQLDNRHLKIMNKHE